MTGILEPGGYKVLPRNRRRVHIAVTVEVDRHETVDITQSGINCAPHPEWGLEPADALPVTHRCDEVETSWSINSVWTFLSEKARVLIFGCQKAAATLAQILSKDSFSGIVISDDAAVYQGFTNAQKCWAHLLRKAIRFTLLEPNNEEYRTFLDGLLNVFHKAKRFAGDRRLGSVGRHARVSQLVDDLSDVCVARCIDIDSEVIRSSDETDCEFQYLVHEVARLMCDMELFTFVLHPEAGAINNEAEQSLRGAAMDRRTDRTSKTPRGAQRRTILMSVLESLKLHLPEFTLSSVLNEVQTWWNDGESLFSQLLSNSGLDPPKEPKLAKLVLVQ
jgi:transposase